MTLSYLQRRDTLAPSKHHQLRHPNHPATSQAHKIPQLPSQRTLQPQIGGVNGDEEPISKDDGILDEELPKIRRENPSETKELCCTGEIKKLGIGRLGGFQLSGRRNQETVEAFGHGTLRFEGVEGIGRTTRKKQWRVDSPAYQIYERMMLARFSHSPECVNRHYRNREQIQVNRVQALTFYEKKEVTMGQ
uniref:Uncharacterized protein n=1 Tax=Physcomitrium patens TaxID=3218 RepID=A0A7I4AYL0_PHYPA